MPEDWEALTRAPRALRRTRSTQRPTSPVEGVHRRVPPAGPRMSSGWCAELRTAGRSLPATTRRREVVELVDRGEQHGQFRVNQIDIGHAENEVPMQHYSVVQHVVDDVEQRRFRDFGLCGEAGEEPVVRGRSLFPRASGHQLTKWYGGQGPLSSRWWPCLPRAAATCATCFFHCARRVAFTRKDEPVT